MERIAEASRLIQIELSPPPRMPKPAWLRAKTPVGDNFHNLKKLARGLGLEAINSSPRTGFATCLPDVNDFQICQFQQLVPGEWQ